MVLVKIPLILGLTSRSFLALTAGNCQMTSETPNNSFKPNLLRYTKAMAEKACHGFGSTTQVGLTQALGLKGTITYVGKKTRRWLSVRRRSVCSHWRTSHDSNLPLL